MSFSKDGRGPAWLDTLKSREAMQTISEVVKDHAVPPLAASLPWRGVYPGMCMDPKRCYGKTYCPRDPSCCE